MRRVSWWQSSILNELDGAYHMFGGMGLDVRKIDELPALLNLIGLPSRMYMVEQVHSSLVRVGSRELTPGDRSVEGDGIVLTRKGEGGLIFTADCVPVLVTSTRGPWGVLIHAGWRGVLDGVVERGVKLLLSETPAEAYELRAALGPAIGPCCFEVGDDVASAFESFFPWSVLRNREGKARVDLKLVVLKILASCGIPEDNIDMSRICTCCDGGYNSYRRDRETAKRQISVLYYP